MRAAVAAMCDQMVARGPDDGGVVDIAAGDRSVALGNRRLAIIDPTPAGHQPMRDEARGLTVVFNGMIYNYRELREELARDGEQFASSCDTEVVLKAYARYGEACVRRLRGMFAFAIWDGRRRQLFMARDPLGIKPLYYWQHGGSLLFASQVKALLQSGRVPARISAGGLQTYLAFGAVSEPLTAIEDVFALPAGCTAVLRDGDLRVARYWSPPHSGGVQRSREDAAVELRALLEDSIDRHLVSDAPLGVFLSGGIDSSVLAALAASRTSRLRTVSVVFDDPAFSERPYIDLVRERIGSDHVSVMLRPDSLLESLGGAFAAMDQPTFDGVNSYVVSRAAASSGLKVALSGLGADELFDGYGYESRMASLELARRLPQPVARFAGGVMRAAGRSGNDDKLDAWLSHREQGDSSYELLRRLFLPNEVARLSPCRDDRGIVSAVQAVDRSRDLSGQVSALDLTNYTKNVLLRDTDAMSMAHSLEVRVPYLDQPLVEWVLNLAGPARRGGHKRLLVEATRDLLPPEIMDRRKQGFALPISRWMRESMRAEVESTLREPPAALSELLNPDAMIDVWERFVVDGRRWLSAWSLFALCRWAQTIATPVGRAA
jgi:asparagine synthase (glutamine-hydrolysing)